jgi:hypothetical protein
VWHEASPIFDTGNPIDIDVLATGVHVRGWKCKAYYLFMDQYGPNNRSTSIPSYGRHGELEIVDWQYWLRRAPVVRVALHKSCTQGWQFFFGDVLSSLCTFLSPEHALRTFIIDAGNAGSTSDVDLYPVRLLGNIQEVQIYGTSPTLRFRGDEAPVISPFEEFGLDSQAVSDRMQDVVMSGHQLEYPEASTYASKMKFIRETEAWMELLQEDLWLAADRFAIAHSGIAQSNMSADDRKIQQFLEFDDAVDVAEDYQLRLELNEDLHLYITQMTKSLYYAAALPANHEISIRVTRLIRAEVDFAIASRLENEMDDAFDENDDMSDENDLVVSLKLEPWNPDRILVFCAYAVLTWIPLEWVLILGMSLFLER